MKKIISGCLAIIMSALIAASLTACGNTIATGGTNTTGGTSTTGDANKGEITVYTALEDEIVEEYLKVFNTKYPDIKVNIVRESTGIITAKLLAEKENIQADLVWGTAASSLLVLDENNMLQPYAPAGADNILPQFKSNKQVPTWVGIDVWETAFTINIVELEKLGLKAS